MKKIKFELLIIATLVICTAATMIFSCKKVESTDKSAVNQSTLLAEDAGFVFQWEYSPTLPSGVSTQYAGAGSVAADSSFIYYKYEFYNTAIGGVHDDTRIDKIDMTGAKKWQSLNVGINKSYHFFPALVGSSIYTHEDKIKKVRTSDGSWGYLDGAGYDDFGSVKQAGNYIVTTNSFQTETLQKPYISLMGLDLSIVWRKVFPFTPARDINRGEVAYDNGKVFYNPSYYNQFVPYTYESGIYCFNFSGDTLWFKNIIPQGRMSAANGRLFSFENNNFTSRDQLSGNLIWQVNATGFAENQPAVLTSNLAIIATTSGVTAYDQSGSFEWHYPLLNILFDNVPYNQENLCMADVGNGIAVTAHTGIYIIDYSGNLLQHIPNTLINNLRPTNPVYKNGNLFVTVADKRFNTYGTHKVICYRNSSYVEVTPPPPPPPPPPVPVASVTLTANGNVLSWVANNITTITSQNLQQYTKRGAVKWKTIYSGNSPKTVSAGQYRVSVNGIISNTISIQ